MSPNRRAVLRTLALLPAMLSFTRAAPSQPAAGRPVLVFAAASLQPALTAIAAAWQAETGKRAAMSFAASSALARQIEQGAPADLFLSADIDWMDWAQARNLVRSGTRRNLLGNTLVLIAAPDNADGLAIAPGFPLARAIGASRLATGDPQSVPVGRYARQALVSLGVWDEVAPRIAGVENVRAALALVARGEARYGIVYASDARSEPRVKVAGVFPASSHPPIIYPAALTAASDHPDAAAFLAYLTSPAATRIFEAEGFALLR